MIKGKYIRTKEIKDKMSKSYTYHTNSGCFKKGQLLGKNHWNWQNGKTLELYPLGWNKTYKEQIRFRDKYKCQLCGIPEVECNRRLSIHHIDYCKENIKDGNLVSLCGKCHSKTNYNREYWIELFTE